MGTARATANKGAYWTWYSAWAGGYSADGTGVPFGGGPSSNPFSEVAFDFNWPTLPTGAVITSATLYFYVTNGMPVTTPAGTPKSTMLYALAESWSVSDTSPPTTGGASDPGSMPTGTATNNSWIHSDATSFAQEHYRDGVQTGFWFGNFASAPNGQPYMHGISTANAPYIDITYTLPPGAPTLTSPNGGETWNASHTITWTAATDSDTAQSSLRYHIQLSTNNGSSWSDIVALTTAGATSYAYDFSAVAESTTCLVRIRAYDGANYGAYDQSDAVFTISHPVSGYHMMI